MLGGNTQAPACPGNMANRGRFPRARVGEALPGWRQIGIEQSGPVKFVGLRPQKNRYCLFLAVPINVIVLCRQTLRRWFRSMEKYSLKRS